MKKEETMSDVMEFYRKEIERMERMGYSVKEIESELDRMIRVQNMVTLALI